MKYNKIIAHLVDLDGFRKEIEMKEIKATWTVPRMHFAKNTLQYTAQDFVSDDRVFAPTDRYIDFDGVMHVLYQQIK